MPAWMDAGSQAAISESRTLPGIIAWLAITNKKIKNR
jgi:hypothetical protein